MSEHKKIFERTRNATKTTIALGALAGVGLFGKSMADAEKPATPDATIVTTAKPGDSSYSLAERYNTDPSIAIRPIADQIAQEPNVKDGLQPGETVVVPVVRPQ
jgi:hypothetical protein